MARLWTCSFELASAANNMELGIDAGGVAPKIDATTFRSGANSMRFDLSAGTNAYCRGSIAVYATVQDRALYCRAYTKVASGSTQRFSLIYVQTTTHHFSVDHSNIDGTLQLWYYDGFYHQIGSSSAAIGSGWHLIELKVDSVANAVAARLDETIFASDDAANVGSLNQPQFGCVSLAPYADVYMDDAAVNDDTGSFQNSWCGSGEVIHLRTSAAGDNAMWTRGGTDSGANWDQVDEVTPNDATDYVQENVLNDIDDYNLADTPAALASDDTINCVQVGHRFLAVLSAFAPWSVLRIKASSGGTVEESAAQKPIASWTTHQPIAPFIHWLTLYDLPGASTTAWTKADLDAAQIGHRISTTGAGLDRETATWLAVDHTAAPAAAADRRRLLAR